ncbi:hypothetical protein LINPERPRIM_LOCUS16731 [Linum perenne]
MGVSSLLSGQTWSEVQCSIVPLAGRKDQGLSGLMSTFNQEIILAANGWSGSSGQMALASLIKVEKLVIIGIIRKNTTN